MNKIYLLLFILTFTATQSMAKQHTNSKSIVLVQYTLKANDTLQILAKRYNTTTSKIVRINKLDRSKRLHLGQVMKIPTSIYRYRELSSTHIKKSVVKVDKITSKTTKIKPQTVTHEDSHITKREDSPYNIPLQINTMVSKINPMDRIGASKLFKPSHKILLVESSSLVKKSKEKNPREIVSNKNIVVKFSKWSEAHPILYTKSSRDLNLSTSAVKLSAARKQLGKRYVWGANGPKTFDCSGFTKYVCKQSGISLPRTSINQSKVGKRVARSNLKAGDLIFFDTSRRHRGYVNHVGIYIGNNKFIHASSAKRRVVIANLNKPFYRSRFKWGSRIKS